MSPITRLKKADWKQTEKEVVAKLRLLHGMVTAMTNNPTNNKIAEDLILPALAHLGRFCVAVQVEEDKAKKN